MLVSNPASLITTVSVPGLGHVALIRRKAWFESMTVDGLQQRESNPGGTNEASPQTALGGAGDNAGTARLGYSSGA